MKIRNFLKNVYFICGILFVFFSFGYLLGWKVNFQYELFTDLTEDIDDRLQKDVQALREKLHTDRSERLIILVMTEKAFYMVKNYNDAYGFAAAFYDRGTKQIKAHIEA